MSGHQILGKEQYKCIHDRAENNGRLVAGQDDRPNQF